MRLDNTSIDFFTGAVPREFAAMVVRLRFGARRDGRVVALRVERMRALHHTGDVAFAVGLDTPFESHTTGPLGGFDAEDVQEEPHFTFSVDETPARDGVRAFRRIPLYARTGGAAFRDDLNRLVCGR